MNTTMSPNQQMHPSPRLSRRHDKTTPEQASYPPSYSPRMSVRAPSTSTSDLPTRAALKDDRYPCPCVHPPPNMQALAHIQYDRAPFTGWRADQTCTMSCFRSYQLLLRAMITTS